MQEGRGDVTGEPVQIVILTHTARERNVEEALAGIVLHDLAVKPSVILRIEGG
jgi:hypothetical protein